MKKPNLKKCVALALAVLSVNGSLSVFASEPKPLINLNCNDTVDARRYFNRNLSNPIGKSAEDYNLEDIKRVIANLDSNVSDCIHRYGKQINRNENCQESYIEKIFEVNRQWFTDDAKSKTIIGSGFCANIYLRKLDETLEDALIEKELKENNNFLLAFRSVTQKIKLSLIELFDILKVNKEFKKETEKLFNESPIRLEVSKFITSLKYILENFKEELLNDILTFNKQVRCAEERQKEEVEEQRRNLQELKTNFEAFISKHEIGSDFYGGTYHLATVNESDIKIDEEELISYLKEKLKIFDSVKIDGIIKEFSDAIRNKGTIEAVAIEPSVKLEFSTLHG